MKMQSVIAAIIAASLALSACASPKTVDSITYQGYGLLNADEKKNDAVEYRIVWGNIFWSVVLVETIIFPIYFFGFSLFEPVGLKCGVKGATCG